MSRPFIFLPIVAALLIFASANTAQACPFCAAVSQTFSEEMASMDVVAITRLIDLPPSPGATNGISDEVPPAKFEVLEVLKGESLLNGKKIIESIYFGDAAVGETFLMMGVDPQNLMWSTPLRLTDRGRRYITQIITLPADGADRLAFFQDYLEDEDEMLARDAYDEFAKAPYATVKDLKDRMKHDQLVAWIEDTDVAANRRRLYLTMLGVCGTADDLPMLEQMLKSEDRRLKAGLDAMIACYLTLKGPEGMPLVEDLFLKNLQAEYADTYAAIMALRFHGTESDIIPKQRILEGLRHMLDRPQLADLVIPDLARWEDWSVMDRMVQLFKEADEKSSWVRVPVINYLRACPLPKSKEYIQELEKIDPAAVKRANTFFPFAPAATPATSESSNNDAADAPQEPPAIASIPVPTVPPDTKLAVTASSTAPAPRVAGPSRVESPPKPNVLAQSWSPNRTLVVIVPWIAGAVLLFLLWVILSGALGATAKQSRR